jgi:membrane protein YqaA with SNARE-associated domain
MTVPPLPASAFGIWLATFAFSAAGGIVPLLNIEAYVLLVSAASPQSEMLPIALAAALGQMAAKSLVYFTGTGALSVPFVARNVRLGSIRARLAQAEPRALAVVLTSAVASVPPFYAVSLAAGALRLRYGGFLAAGCAGTFVRFAVLFALPRLLG